MKTNTIEIGNLVSTLSAAGVERQLAALPGVDHVDVNYVAGSATVHYDEARVTLRALRQRVADCGYHCGGELVPAHVCSPADHAPKEHVPASHATTDRKGDGPTTSAPKASAAAPGDAHAVHAKHGAGGHAVASPAGGKDDMMHDMGHSAGMSMQVMARDMRNRFFVSLVFAIPVFVYSPMGRMLGDFATPFGLDRKIFLFIVATAGIAYPGWPFFVAAWRATRNGVANMGIEDRSVESRLAVQRRKKFSGWNRSPLGRTGVPDGEKRFSRSVRVEGLHRKKLWTAP